MSKAIKIAVEGEATGAVAAFDKVGDASRNMAAKVDESATAQTRLGEKIGSNEAKFAGAADLLDGLGGAFGLPTEGATALMRGFSDLSGGFEVVSGIIPALSGHFPKLASAMTFVSAHPLLVAVMVGGAIIAGLILLEKKFGIVSGAVKALGSAFMAAWNSGVKPAVNLILSGVEAMVNGISSAFNGSLGRLPGIPDIPRLNLPRLDVGGTVLQTGLAVVHRGEVVNRAGGGTMGAGGSPTVVLNVYGSVSTEVDLIDAVHAGLQRKGLRTGSLNIA